ncbi:MULTISPECIES: DUF1572 family protein [Paenibacillus]|uniref:DUF1572 family protein n=1 Tax=Paenibacillus TaxID=44249 RepID=UPI0022B86D55|nr:DUF1572 family protein [Paenibacillus caseinilyticus]MCZ8523538.1 DUF1572 family protein [Paenibacillus caseinilyticus]
MSEGLTLGTVMLEESIETFRSMKKLGDRTLEQLEETQFHAALDPESNTMEVIIRHMHGNMLSRWTDFLHSDGEKPTRDRDGEFVEAGASRESLLALWEEGWAAVFGTLASLRPEDLLRTVTIRGEAHTVVKAIQRQVSHYGYHVGQMVFLGKHLRSSDWQTLSIARGQSRAFRPGT